jgi:hypothetical protein
MRCRAILYLQFKNGERTHTGEAQEDPRKIDRTTFLMLGGVIAAVVLHDHLKTQEARYSRRDRP